MDLECGARLADGDTAQTYGWDTVFVIHIAEANAAIAAQKTSPASFHQADAADGYVFEGAFGDWSIVPGGDGDIICLALPVGRAAITGPGGPWTLAGVIRANVRLDLLHDAEVPGRRHLKVRATAVAPDTPVATVVGATWADPQPTFLAATVAHALMQDWLNEHLADFDHVFATVDLDRRAASGAFQWMQPTDTAYAYTDLGTATDGALAILAMTGGRKSDGLIQQVSSACLPARQRAALVIAKARIMEELLLPSIPLSFAESRPQDFRLSATGDSIVNATENIRFRVTHKDKHYAAVVKDLRAVIEAQELRLDVTTETQLSPGIRAFTRTISRLGMTLGVASDGGQALEFQDAAPAVVTHWTETDPGIELAEDILAAAALVAAAVATVVTDGAAVGALALAIGFAAGVMMVTDESIKAAGENKAPSIGAAALDATSAIRWPCTSGFVLASADLDDSLRLTGAYAN